MNGLYLDLMKRALMNSIYKDPNIAEGWPPEFDEERRANGLDWPRDAHTMIGLKRLDNIQTCAEQVIRDGIPGDFIETGVWRGGACIFMRAILKAYQVTDRFVWVADSFAGLPTPNVEKYPDDEGDQLSTIDFLAVSLETVQGNFRAYGLLDQQVKFLKGWFRDTLPLAPVERLALLRLDGDMYESTTDALVNLYPKLSPGGYCIIDDYGTFYSCRKAVHDYREAHRIDEPVQEIDSDGVFWQKRAPVQ
ncbi:MAG TPA: TylF/MycF family methyltransferase [Pyrinomonadaceae bacterium]|nr:TylF/MycF family methyltransferase [Pyrinomonadaceae bacterium]